MKKKTPILFITFNRIDTTLKVLSSIKIYKPSKFYIFSDGPRTNMENEMNVINDLRNIILKNIDWECEVFEKFMDFNLGCGLGPSNAITWFFNFEKEGIILEDDCLPNMDFFNFCEEMLVKYEYDKSIMQINGFNNLGSNLNSNQYYMSNYPRIWGWATWKNRWEKFNYKMDDWDLFKNNKSKYLKRFNWLEGKILFFIWYLRRKELIKYPSTSYWDYQWHFSVMMNDGICIEPVSNLVKNIGFSNGTHFTDSETIFSKTEFGKMTSPFLCNNDISKKMDNKYSILFIKQKLFRIIK